MKFKLLACLGPCFFIMPGVFAQHLSFPIVFQKAPEGVFSFTQKWDYPEGIVKHDDGTIEKTDGEKIEPADTSHEYFSANCKTNVQGGYIVNYCSAKRRGANINLTFSGGLPAYANEFDVIQKGNTFIFDPHVIYPDLILNEKLAYRVTGAKLVLYQQNQANAGTVSGYIKAQFIETIQRHHKHTRVNKYYFEGYFKTVIN